MLQVKWKLLWRFLVPGGAQAWQTAGPGQAEWGKARFLRAGHPPHRVLPAGLLAWARRARHRPLIRPLPSFGTWIIKARERIGLYPPVQIDGDGSAF